MKLVWRQSEWSEFWTDPIEGKPRFRMRVAHFFTNPIRVQVMSLTVFTAGDCWWEAAVPDRDPYSVSEACQDYVNGNKDALREAAQIVSAPARSADFSPIDGLRESLLKQGRQPAVLMQMPKEMTCWSQPESRCPGCNLTPSEIAIKNKQIFNALSNPEKPESAEVLKAMSTETRVDIREDVDRSQEIRPDSILSPEDEEKRRLQQEMVVTSVSKEPDGTESVTLEGSSFPTIEEIQESIANAHVETPGDPNHRFYTCSRCNKTVPDKDCYVDMKEGEVRCYDCKKITVPPMIVPPDAPIGFLRQFRGLHCFVENLDNFRFYDAEVVNGVSDWKNLPTYKREKVFTWQEKYDRANWASYISEIDGVE